MNQTNWKLKRRLLLLIMAAHSQVILAQEPQFNAEEAILDREHFKAVLDKVKAEEKQKLIEYLTGLSGVQNVTSTIENFLPDFQLASLLNEGDAFAGKDQIQVDFSFLLNGTVGDDNNAKLRAVINRNAELSKDLTATFGAEVLAPFADDIGTFDDVQYSFSYNITNKKYGRSTQPHRERFRALVEQVRHAQSVQAVQKSTRDLILKLGTDQRWDKYNLSGSLTDDQILNQFSGSEEDRAAFIRLRKQIFEANKISQVALSTAVTSAKLNRFYELVANQPQLQLALDYRSRDPLVGADEFSFKVNYEVGFTNINSLRKEIAKNCAESASQSCQFRIYQSYMTQEERLAGLKSGSRLSFGLKYSDVSDHRYELANTPFLKKGGSKLEGSVAYGRTLVRNLDLEPVMRVDAGIKFEEYLNDTEGNDRFVANVTFTRKLKNGMSIPFGIEYANKTEFLSDDSKQFGGHIGFKYDFL